MKSMRDKIVVIVFCLLAGTLLEAAWTSKRLTVNADDSRCPAVAVSGANVYVVWHDSTPGNPEIYFRRSTDGGVTWQSAMRLTNNAGESGYADIAVSGANVYVVWMDKTPGNIEIFFRRSTDGGVTWQNARRLTNTVGDSVTPVVTVRNSKVYVAWSDDTPGNEEIYFRRSLDGGATWKTAKRLTNNAGDSTAPALAVSGSSVYAAWSDNTPGNSALYFKRSLDGGWHWQPARRLGSGGDNITCATMVARGATVYLAACSDSEGNGEIYFASSADNGTNWGEALRITYTAGNSTGTKLAANDAHICLCWMDDTPGDYEVYFKRSIDGGSTWQVTQRLTYTDGHSILPDMAVSGAKAYVVYSDGTPGNDDIYIKYQTF